MEKEGRAGELEQKRDECVKERRAEKARFDENKQKRRKRKSKKEDWFDHSRGSEHMARDTKNGLRVAKTGERSSKRD